MATTGEVTHNLLVRELCKVTEWDVLGIYLGLDESEITEIERDHQSNARRRIVMLGKWIKKDGDASWEKVIGSLETMSLNTLANQLKEKFTSIPSTTACPSIESEKVLMVDRQELVVREIEDLERTYLELVMEAESAVDNSNPQVRKLKRFSQSFMSKDISTVAELFDQLKPFYFLEYALLEMIVKFFLPREHVVVDNLRDYHEQLIKFKSSTTVLQFMENIEQAQQSHDKTKKRPGLCNVTVHLVGGWLTKTMDDLEKLVKELFKDKRYVLTHLKIVRGSVIVTFSAPLSEADSLITVAKTTTEYFMLEVGLFGLHVGRIKIISSRMPSLFFFFGSSLLKAVTENNLNLISFLLNINTNPDAANNMRQTGLMLACFYNFHKAASLLLKANANPNLKRFDGLTSLNIASQLDRTIITKALLEANADPNIQSDDGITPLLIASELGNTEIVDMLLKANADPDIKCNETLTPLFIASHKKHSEVVDLLLKANANHSIQTEYGETPLYIASQIGHIPTITLLLKANADPSLPIFSGETPLHIASVRGRSNVVSLLLEANANPNLQAKDGMSSLYIASQNGHADIVTLLLNANADPNLHRISGESPLYIAIQRSYFSIIALLLKANANPNLQTDAGTTPLMSAIVFRQPQVVQLLLASGADPNLQHSSGLTALMFACQAGYLDTVELLMNSGADPSMKSEGLTALEIAADRGHEDIVDLLEAIKLSQSTITSPVHTANEIASTVVIDNRTMSLMNKARENMLVKDTESYIRTQSKKFEKSLPLKQSSSEPIIGQ